MNGRLTGKERAALRAQANGLSATVHVGQHGLSATLIKSLDDALRTRELVKVQLGRTADIPSGEAARQLAGATSAQVIQVIGRTTTLYRHNPDLKREAGGAPPWQD
ncbi:MAG TPA: YhbY family RNA-binding protein [Gemmatimonadaceae bacterium]|nr:YhbY family RNA-binding protein [Gemmatimonadaceae bacterium]